jgi:hypothetical protein
MAPQKRQNPYSVRVSQTNCGEGGIRTLGTVARTTVFETATIDRSATSPGVHPGWVQRDAKIGFLGQIGRGVVKF